MVDLSHCRKCDTYYLRSAGGCKWCGTPAVSRSRRSAVSGLGGGLVVLALAALVYFRFIRTEQAPPAGASDSTGANATQVVLAPPATNAVLDSGTIDSALLTTLDTAPVPDLISLAAPTAPVVAPPPLRSTTVAWVRATALTYINVRSAADRKAPVVGVVTPSMKVELGARHLGWRQVRAPGVSGWADPRNFSVEGVGAPR